MLEREIVLREEVILRLEIDQVLVFRLFQGIPHQLAFRLVTRRIESSSAKRYR